MHITLKRKVLSGGSLGVLDDEEQVVPIRRHHDFVLLRSDAQEGEVVLRIQITNARSGLDRQLGGAWTGRTILQGLPSPSNQLQLLILTLLILSHPQPRAIWNHSFGAHLMQQAGILNRRRIVERRSDGNAWGKIGGGHGLDVMASCSHDFGLLWRRSYNLTYQRVHQEQGPSKPTLKTKDPQLQTKLLWYKTPRHFRSIGP